MTYKIIDLFCGVGGLSYGFSHDNDFIIIAANEILPNMAKAYSLNHPSVKVYNKDIKDFSASDLYNDFGIKPGDIDIIIGGPPCQSFSTVGKRIENDPRGQLFNEYYRILSELKPQLFVFENVKGLLSIQKGKLMKHIISLFETIGYKVQWKILNAADYGTPQIRERVIIVGTLNQKPFKFPLPTHYNPETTKCNPRHLKPYVTLGEAIGDLTEIENGGIGTKYLCKPQNDYQKLMRVNAPPEIMDHQTPKNSKKMIDLMKALPDGGTPKDIPAKLRPKSGFANTYCRLWWNKPSTTITRNLGCPSSSRCIHPKFPRPLSTREGARLQGFPDNYIFYGSRSDKNLQIGNAVPTFLSCAIKDAVKDFMNGNYGDEEKTLF